jgi:hypothetical protein
VLTGRTAGSAHRPGTGPEVDLEDETALDFTWECEAAPSASPFAGPLWAAAVRGTSPQPEPIQWATARVGGAAGALAFQVIERPVSADTDPRSYFGWRPAALEGGCCGTPLSDDLAPDLESLAPDDLFPMLLLGSLAGFQSEVLHPRPTAQVANALIGTAMDATRPRARSVLAPWVSTRPGGVALAEALEQRRSVTTFWAVEDHLELPHGSFADHLAALNYRARYRARQDMAVYERTGLERATVVGPELKALAEPMSRLVAANKARHGMASRAHELPQAIDTVVSAGVPVVATTASKDGELVACCVSIAKDGRLYAKYAGFDYERVGTRSGLYPAVVLWATVEAAYELGCRAVEFGVGAHEAKRIRGCASRELVSHLVVHNPSVRVRFDAASALSSRSRRQEYGVEACC